MRLFIGISPTDEIRRSLVKMQNFLQRHGITGSYLTPENLHMTLAFIGEYPEIDPVMDAMEEVAFSAFPIAYNRIGTFRESIVWGGIEPSEPLNILVKSVRHHLSMADIPFDNSAFSPHFTLARHADFSKGIPQVEIEPVNMPVDQIILYRSDRGKSGMIYTVIGIKDAVNTLSHSETKICKCFAPPPGTPFEKGGIYRWEYGIDSIHVYHESGVEWYDGEIMFAARFQILNGKE